MNHVVGAIMKNNKTSRFTINDEFVDFDIDDSDCHDLNECVNLKLVHGDINHMSLKKLEM